MFYLSIGTPDVCTPGLLVDRKEKIIIISQLFKLNTWAYG